MSGYRPKDHRGSIIGRMMRAGTEWDCRSISGLRIGMRMSVENPLRCRCYRCKADDYSDSGRYRAACGRQSVAESENDDFGFSESGMQMCFDQPVQQKRTSSIVSGDRKPEWIVLSAMDGTLDGEENKETHH